MDLKKLKYIRTLPAYHRFLQTIPCSNETLTYTKEAYPKKDIIPLQYEGLFICFSFQEIFQDLFSVMKNDGLSDIPDPLTFRRISDENRAVILEIDSKFNHGLITSYLRKKMNSLPKDVYEMLESFNERLRRPAERDLAFFDFSDWYRQLPEYIKGKIGSIKVSTSERQNVSFDEMLTTFTEKIQSHPECIKDILAGINAVLRTYRRSEMEDISEGVEEDEGVEENEETFEEARFAGHFAMYRKEKEEEEKKEEPPRRSEEKDWNLILDLDGVLVQEVDSPDKIPAPRPYLQEFLAFVFSNFSHVALWSASSPERIAEILPIVNLREPFYFIWSGDKTTRTPRGRSGDYSITKKLKRVYKAFPDFTQDNTLILDDTPSTYKHNYGNAIGILTWSGDPEDKALLTLIENLKLWKKEYEETGTVRHIHKYALPAR